jgi:hypothetical protein
MKRRISLGDGHLDKHRGLPQGRFPIAAVTSYYNVTGLIKTTFTVLETTSMKWGSLDSWGESISVPFPSRSCPHSLAHDPPPSSKPAITSFQSPLHIAFLDSWNQNYKREKIIIILLAYNSCTGRYIVIFTYVLTKYLS